MARLNRSATPSGYTMLVIDDVPEVLESTSHLLKAEGHRVLTAPDGPTALALLEKERVQVILCDYFMPGMTGEEVVRRIRERGDHLVQIILQTGYSGEKPARVMMRELEIQGYHDKGEGGERLLLWVDTALKTYRHVCAMEKHRTGLRFILDITPELHRMQPVDELLEGLLWQIEGLVGAENSFFATVCPSAPLPHLQEEGAEAQPATEGFVALVDSANLRSSLEIRFGTGRYQAHAQSEAIPEAQREMIYEALQNGQILVEDGFSIVPLMLGKRPLGVIYLDRRTGYQRDRDLLEVFAYQAAAAIQNSLLYDLATTDSLTGVYLRGFAIQQLQHAIKRSLRRNDALSLLMIDLDKFKQINDTYGHQAGDHALRAVGELLRETVRETDIVGRYGGDEFMVILPDTPPAGALIVANRLLERSKQFSIEEEGHTLPIRLSLGIGTLHATREEAEGLVEPDGLIQAAENLIACADRALYAAKGSGLAGERGAVSFTDLLKTA